MNNTLNVYGQMNRSKIINCGIEYLSNTIGISIIDDQIYQIFYENDNFHIIIYNNKEKRFNKTTTDNEIIEYEMDLSNGHLHQFDDIIQSELIREQLLNIFHLAQQQKSNENVEKSPNNVDDDDDNKKKMQALIMKNKKEKNQIKFILYETTYLLNHFIAIYNDYYNENLQLMEIGFEELTKIIMISDDDDDEQLKFITYEMDGDSININNEKLSLNYYLFINLNKPNEFISTERKYKQQLNSQQLEYSRQKIRENFVQYRYRFGFILRQKFHSIKGEEDQDQEEEEEILFLFSNKMKQVLSFNIGNIFTNKTTAIPFQQQDYQKFFNCKYFQNNDSINNNNDDNNKEKRITDNDLEVKSKLSIKFLIIIPLIIIIIIILPLFSIVTMICYQHGYCQYNLCHQYFDRNYYLQKKLQKLQQEQRKETKRLKKLLKKTIKSKRINKKKKLQTSILPSRSKSKFNSKSKSSTSTTSKSSSRSSILSILTAEISFA